MALIISGFSIFVEREGRLEREERQEREGKGRITRTGMDQVLLNGLNGQISERIDSRCSLCAVVVLRRDVSNYLVIN